MNTDHPASILTVQIRESRDQVRTRINAIGNVVKQAYGYRPGHRLPDPFYLKFFYTGSRGVSSIESISVMNDGDGEWHDCLNKSDYCPSLYYPLRQDPENHVLILIDLMAGLSSHGEWKLGYGGRGDIEINLIDNTVISFHHVTHVLTDDHNYVNVGSVLGYAQDSNINHRIILTSVAVDVPAEALICLNIPAGLTDSQVLTVIEQQVLDRYHRGLLHYTPSMNGLAFEPKESATFPGLRILLSWDNDTGEVLINERRYL